MQTQIKFTASGANSAIGGFAPGDKARVDSVIAAHLVDVAKVAVYVDAPEPVQVKVKLSKKSKG